MRLHMYETHRKILSGPKIWYLSGNLDMSILPKEQLNTASEVLLNQLSNKNPYT